MLLSSSFYTSCLCRLIWTVVQPKSCPADRAILYSTLTTPSSNTILARYPSTHPPYQIHPLLYLDIIPNIPALPNTKTHRLKLTIHIYLTAPFKTTDPVYFATNRLVGIISSTSDISAFFLNQMFSNRVLLGTGWVSSHHNEQVFLFGIRLDEEVLRFNGTGLCSRSPFMCRYMYDTFGESDNWNTCDTCINIWKQYWRTAEILVWVIMAGT
jgi:hypothetical protein